MSKNSIFNFITIGLLVITTIWLSPLVNKPLTQSNTESEFSKAEIINIENTTNETQKLTLELEKPANKKITIEHNNSIEARDINFSQNDQVIVEKFNQGDQESFVISSFNRYQSLFLLFIVFVATVFIVAGLQGLRSLTGLIVSFAILFKFFLPEILTGTSPLWIGSLAILIITPILFIISHGINRHTLVAVFSTMLTVCLSALIAYIFIGLTNLTGLASEETAFLKLSTQSLINFRGLLLIGIIFSALGVLDDITIGQVSVVQELKAAKPNIKAKELFQRAMTVGRNHISSLVNTLVLVYAGVSLPLLLLFVDDSQPFFLIVNSEFMTEEIVRTLVGSIALVLAVPIATILTVYFGGKQKPQVSGCSHSHH